MKKLYFLGGLPRSGSTLLGSILNQHPDIYVSPTSPLGELIKGVELILNNSEIQYTFNRHNIENNIYSAIINNFYNHIEKPITIDKHRFWCQNINNVKKFLPDHNKPKIIATYRPIPEVITSYISLIERTNQDNVCFLDQHLIKDNLPITNNNRTEYIWRYYLSPSYESMVLGLNNHPELIHLVEYDKLISNPQDELNKIYEFLEVSSYTNSFHNIKNFCGEEKDEAWGLKGLHDIRPNLSKISQDPIKVIGEENFKLYSKFNI